MKKISLHFITILLSGVFILLSGSIMAQEEVIKEKREVPAFTGVDVGGAFDVYLSQGETFDVSIETEAKHMEKIRTDVNGDILEITSKGIKKSKVMKAYITAPEISFIDIHGAASLRGKTPLKGETLKIYASGASDGKLEVYYTHVKAEASGAANITLSGKADQYTSDVSGAASAKAGGLTARVAKASASGAASSSVNATEEVITNTSGAGNVDLVKKPTTLTIVAGEAVTETENIRVYTTDYGDTTKVKVAGIRVEVIENDSTKVIIGNRQLTVSEDGNVKWCKVKKRKFNGHWAGVELGMNGYVTKDFNMKFKPEDEFMDLRMEKSMQFNLNLYEQNVALSKSQNWGMLTGIGISWNNYRFRNPTSLNPDSAYLIGYKDKGISVKTSKLAIAYLQIPLIVEWQNQAARKINSFHVGVGVVFGVRMWSWQKKYYNELNKEYTLTQYDPLSDQYVDKYTRTSPNYNKTHTYDDYHLQPFKADATLRIGWGYVNLFATYNLVQMFRVDKGPELHQFAAGITLLGW